MIPAGELAESSAPYSDAANVVAGGGTWSAR